MSSVTPHHPHFLRLLQSMVNVLRTLTRRKHLRVLPLLGNCLGVLLCLSCLNPLLGQHTTDRFPDIQGLPFDGSSSFWNGTSAPLSGNSLQPASTYGVFKYTDNGTSITITGYTGAGGAITIPDLIDGKPVATIGDSAFYQKTVTSVIIPNGVTSIGKNAFSGCASLRDVSIPNSVTSIGDSAFFYCSGLTSVSIPDSVTNIGSSAFSYCSTLTSVTIGNSVASIGDYAFYYCSALTSVTIPSSVSRIGNEAFSSCSGLTSVTIPNSVTSIGVSAFSDCSALTSVTIPSSVTSIGDSAFSYCIKLTSVTIPSSVTSIGSSAFSHCTALTSVSIPNSVTSIASSAFYFCFKLTSVTIPDSVTSIGGSAFSNCYKLTSVSIPNSVTSIGDSAFSDCSGLTSVSIPNSVTSIGGSAFSYCTGLTSVSIPNSVTNIARSAFSYCIKLTSVTIPDSVTSIWYSAFSGCSALTSVTIPNSVTSIGGSAFSYCSSLTSVSIPSSVTSIGDSAFSSCIKLTSVSIPSSVTSIGGSAFSSCIKLTSVTIPSSVTSIGYSAFSSCSALTSITIPSSVTSIGYSAFSSCSALTSITIPNSVTSIGGSAFSYCSALTSVSIPNSVTSIGYRAFYSCNRLENFVVNTDNVFYASINGVLFNKTISVLIQYPQAKLYTSYNIPSSVTNIDDYAFYDCSALTSVTIPNSITSIGYGAFKNCSKLSSVSIPKSVTSIWDSAFSGCSGLISATFEGNSPAIFGSTVFSSTAAAFTIYYRANATGFTSPTWKGYRSSVALMDILEQPTLNFTHGGNVYWIGQTTTTHDGVDAAQSGTITHSQSSTLQTTVNGPRTVSFWWKVSSESGSDYLAFYIDGVEQTGKISGEVNWAQKTYELTTGTHTLKWTYSKNASISAGSDCGWVDELSVVYPTTRILGLSGNLNFGNVFLNQTSSQPLTLSNTGNAPLTVSAISYPAGFRGNWSSGTIAAGASQIITVSFTPTQTLAYAGTITITANQTSATNTIACSGIGVPVATFADWSTTAFTPEERNDPAISGPLADPDNSGLNNLIRYAFSLSRADTTSPNLPVQTVVIDTGSNSNAYNTTDFTLRNDPQLTYRIEVSSDMVNWHYNGDGQGGPYVTITPVDNGDGTTSVHAQDLTPVADTQPRYSRVVLVHP
ncbi:MAG: leucine-rich repeat protein [Verrucomicrobiota bacterium]|nr:leucine-rich repeat protein [Verrucomicrobiota bacterium]